MGSSPAGDNISIFNIFLKNLNAWGESPRCSCAENIDYTLSSTQSRFRLDRTAQGFEENNYLWQSISVNGIDILDMDKLITQTSLEV